MATACTEILFKRQLSFEEYVIICGLGYYTRGPLIDVVPEKFKPSDSTLLKIKKTKKLLEEIQRWDKEQAEREAKKAYQEKLEEWQKDRDKKSKNCQLLETMLTKVRKWEPPIGHEELKPFMINKLKESIISDFPDRPKPKKLSGAEYQQQQIVKLKREIKYYIEDHRKEVERTKAYNKLLRTLRESLKSVF